MWRGQKKASELSPIATVLALLPSASTGIATKTIKWQRT